MLKSEVRCKPWILTISVQKCFLHCEINITPSACFEELAECTALEFLGPNKLRRHSVQSVAQRRDPLAWEGKGQTQGTGWGCDSLGREKPEPGVVLGLPGPVGGCRVGRLEAGTCSAAGLADLDTQL